MRSTIRLSVIFKENFSGEDTREGLAAVISVKLTNPHLNLEKDQA